MQVKQFCVYGLFWGLIWIVLLAANTVSAGHVSDLLKKMSDADESLSYQGVFIMRKSDNLMTMRVQHGTDERGVWESLESLNGEARKVIRVNDEVTSIYPERKLIIVSNNKNKATLHPTLPENLDKLEAFYQINRLEDDRIAGHHTAVLDVKPNDGHRYGYRYWLDTETGVLLKCDLLNEQGTVVEQMMFTALEYLSAAPESAFNNINHADFDKKRLDKGRTDTQNVAWQVSSLPDGFMLTQSSLRKRGDDESVHLVYSDGLASVSVFIEQGEGTHHRLDGASTMGALNAYGSRVGKHFVTVMGEVPAATVMQIAQSTRQAE